MVPPESAELWQYAQEAVATAKAKGAKCKDAHIEKAHIHAFLAWHDPPGQKLGFAITQRALDPHAPSAAPFVQWFRSLYELEALP